MSFISRSVKICAFSLLLGHSASAFAGPLTDDERWSHRDVGAAGPGIFGWDETQPRQMQRGEGDTAPTTHLQDDLAGPAYTTWILDVLKAIGAGEE